MGWDFVQRSASRFAVDLGVRGQFVQAVIDPVTASAIRLRATLATYRSPVAATRLALGVLLLTTSAAVRLVRGGASAGDGDEYDVYIETWLDTAASADDLQHALSALSVAGQMVARETRAVADERVARSYLSARGWAGSDNDRRR